MKDFYKKYLCLLIELNGFHSSQWENRNLVTPCLLSEGLCKMLLGLDDRKPGEKHYDAIDKVGKKYEIKATSSPKGTTTYNPKSQVDFLIWIFFDYNREELVIKQIRYSEIVNKNLKTDMSDDCSEISISTSEIDDFKKRETIILSNIKNWDSERRFCMRSLKELK